MGSNPTRPSSALAQRRRSIEFHRHPGIDGFLAEAGPFLEARSTEHNLILVICSTLESVPGDYPGANDLLTVTRGGSVVLVAVRTPPWPMVLSEVDHPGAIGVLVNALADEGVDLAGVNGPVEHVRSFSRRWSAATGAVTHHDLSERIFRLRSTIPSRRPATGRLRAAGPQDRDLLIAWLRAFVGEALGETDQPPAAAMADRWLRGGSRTMFLWDDDGPVSMAGRTFVPPNGARIGPVYTPPERRGRGYASALVTAASQGALDAGREECVLYTDLANPTSNHIYQEIGYRAVRDIEVHRFERA